MGTQAFIDPAERGHLIGKEATSKETIDGNRNIFIDGDMAFMEQLAPSYKEIDHRLDRLISSLGIAGQDLLSNHKPIIVNTGNSFLVVPLKDETMVLSARPDFGAIHKISEEFDLIGYYIFSQHTEVPERDAGARMFAPLYGINEESATGMAAGPLACYLYDKMGINKDLSDIAYSVYATHNLAELWMSAIQLTNLGSRFF